MTGKNGLGLMLLCALSVGAHSVGDAQDQRAKIKSLPPAVQKTVEEQSKGAQIRGISKEVEKRKTQYELELTVDGRSRDMIIDPTGAILEVEEGVTLESLSPAVKAEIEKSLGGAKLLKLETVTKG